METTNYIAGFALIVSIFNMFLYIRQDRRAQRLITSEKKGILLVRVYDVREVHRGVVKVLNEIERLGESSFKEDRVKSEKLLEEFDDVYQQLGDPDIAADPAILELARSKIIGLEEEGRSNLQRLIGVRDKLRRAAISSA